MKKKQQKMQAENKLYFDILQLFFALVAIFFLLSLLSYSPEDPSSFKTIKGDEPTIVNNLFGNVGAMVAGWLGAIFGWPALFIPILSFYISILLYRYKNGLTFFAAPFMGFLYGICIISCFSILSGLIGGSDLYFPQKNGSALGSIASVYIQSVIGKVGGIIVFLVLILTFIMLLFSVSLSDMGKMFRIIATKFIALKEKLLTKRNSVDELFNKDVKNNDDTLEDEIIEENNVSHSKEVLEEEIKENTDIEKEETETKTEEKEEVIHYSPIIKEPIKVETVINADNSKNIDEDNVDNYDYLEEQNNEIEFKAPIETEIAKFSNYNVPLNLLAEPDNSTPVESKDELQAKGDLLVEKLKDFGVNGIVRAIQPGPVVTMFEYEPAPGTRVSKISSLDSDLALNMSAISVRIIAPIPGTNAVGIEMPNKHRATVFLKELFQSQEFVNYNKPLAVALGKDSIGRPYMADVAKMPHLLVAGTTGSGKSVALNVMICSILYKSSPDKVKFIMIDPKAVELSIYDGIPHMLAPVVTDSKLASSVLKNVATEMDRRYNLFKEKEVRGIDSYNDIVSKDGSAEEMPYIIVIVDEFADLMMVAGKEVETSIIRIAQKARAAGIHLIIATQRPDANVITGLIRSNMPARLGLRVSQKINSRIILDQNGAETLLGRGDSLFLPPGSSDLVRVHGAFVSDDEVRDVVKYLKTLGEPVYDMSMVKEDEGSVSFDDDDEDPEYARAVEVAYEKGSVSISMIQRQLRIGYNKAARIVETMEKRGIVGPSDGTAKPRPVIR